MTRPIAAVAIWRWALLVIGAAALVVALLVSGSSSAQTVATIDGTQITAPTFNHWLKSSAISAHSQTSTIPPFPPDAPNYTRCIAFVNAAQVKSGKHPTHATLLSDCRQLRTALAEEVMQFLISSHWILHEGTIEGVSVTPSAVQSAVHSSLPKTGLVSYLRGSGLSRSDLTFEARVSLIAQKLSNAHAGATPTITAAQVQQFYTANKSLIGNETLLQATPAIRQELIAEAQAPAVEKYLSTVQKRFQPLTTCARGYRIAYYCKKT
jgi:foldase protein PrsA